jgi:glycosyltransferase involved in cell wall biosynthesis
MGQLVFQGAATMSGPHHPPNMIQEINHLITGGNLTEALEATERAITEHGTIHLYQEKKAEILVLMGDRNKAAEAIGKAIQLRPDLTYLPQRFANLTKSPAANPTDAKDKSKNVPTLDPFCGIFDRYPDTTCRRKAEGGLRLRGILKADTEDEPLVSIVTVVFNNPVSLERCLQSIFHQDYPNVECIVIDGGSGEPTLEVIRKLEDHIDYYVSEPDSGIYPAMNKGIQLARGQFVCLLNSDDHYDPAFVSKTVALAIEKRSMLVFSDYIHGDQPVTSRGINQGILFCNLNLNHGAFLVNRRCYNLVGPYPENYKIMGDAAWMRAAFKAGVRFDHLPEPLLTFAADGLSSGESASHRALFISEAIRISRHEFDFLTPEEAEEIYLLRFNPKRLRNVLATAAKYPTEDRFRESLALYVEHCFRDREKFRLSESDSRALFPHFLEACKKLGVPVAAIRMTTKRGCFSEFIASIDRALALRKPQRIQTVLHFVYVFSTPSETFIYDLLLRMEKQTGFDNFVLYDHQKLSDTRPFAKGVWIPWADFRAETREAIYRHLIESLQPDIIIGHFALNTWKITQRIAPLKIRIPIISMTHGIDVFMIGNEGPYRDFILKQHTKQNDMRFTAVSGYLRDRLVGFGVPVEKIDLIPNSINPRFMANRKSADNRSPGDSVRLLAIGRLIDWKGHRHLIQALALALPRTQTKLTLTIVYANGEDLLQEVKDQIEQLNLQESVELIPFVDFDQDAGFISRFDLFVHPSTFSGDGLQRTETFGMSVLEAIAAGLPVIATNAGGVPEVIGESNCFARIVPHGDAEAMAEAILAAIQDPGTFGDNRQYAEERLARFSERAQLVALAQSIFRVTGHIIEAALFSTSTLQGAGYAAYRLHRGLLATGNINPTLHTTTLRHRSQPGIHYVPHPTMKGNGWKTIQNPANSWPRLTIFSLNQPIILNSRIAEWIEDADVINLHWTARFLSLENIAYLTRSGKPVVLTLRDMFPITGGCHYFHGCDGWMKDCHNCPQLIDRHDDLSARVLKAKRRHYDFTNLTLVALSQHSAAILRRAPMFQDCRIEIIPNSIETEVFIPRGKAAARERLGLPQDRQIIAYVPSFSSDVKGFREATAALTRLLSILPGEPPLVLLVGRETPATSDIPLEKHVLGYMHDTEELSYAYSAADVLIVPSLEETFSNTTAEAIACGTPVVGFRTGAIPELAVNGHTGYTVEIGDVEGFAQGIANVLQNSGMAANCRKHAEELLQFDLQAQRYEKLFTELVAVRESPPVVTSEWVTESFPEITGTIANLMKRALAAGC